MNTLFIIYTFVTLVCLFQIIILTCEATRQKRQIERLQSECEYLSKQVKSLIKIADNSSKIDHLVKDKLDNISDTLDLYKRLVDSLNDGQAQLNFRVQQLEMLNSSAILTDMKGGCPYTLNGLCGNPFHDCIGCLNHGTSPNHGTSGVVHDTVSTDRFEPIDLNFTKEE